MTVKSSSPYIRVRCTGCNQKLKMNKTFIRGKGQRYQCILCIAFGREYELIPVNIRTNSGDYSADTAAHRSQWS